MQPRGDFRAAARTLARFGQPHLRWLCLGLAASLGVVACRLAIPWPLRWAIDLAVGPAAPSSSAGWLAAGDPALRLMALYLGIAAALGACELIQRTNLVRYAAQLVHDLRAAAVRGAAATGIGARGMLGDLTARIIGDSARIKSDVSGILVHATTNGVLFVAVCAVMLWVSRDLGLVFVLSGAIAIWIGLSTSHEVADTASRQRAHEGRYANAIQARLLGADPQLSGPNDASARKEVRATRLIARSSLVAHVVLAGGVSAGVWMGVDQVRGGSMAPGELFLFIAYALTVQRRMVQVGRQTARAGKVVACTTRLCVLMGDAGPVEAQSGRADRAAPPAELRLEGVTLSSPSARRPRLLGVDLCIEPGARVAVVGRAGSGKSSLLRLIGGLEPEWEGAMLMDDTVVASSGQRLAARAEYLPQEPVFPRGKVWRILGLSDRRELSPAGKQVLRDCGAWDVIRDLPGKFSAKLGSFELTQSEARGLGLGRILLASDAPVWLLDAPLEALPKSRALRRLDAIWRRAGQRTLVLSMTRPLDLARFDRVLRLRRGRLVYDGPPAGWKLEAAREGAPPESLALARESV